MSWQCVKCLHHIPNGVSHSCINDEMRDLQERYADALKTIEKLTIENVKLEAYALDSVDEKIHLERVGELKKYNEFVLKMLEEMAEALEKLEAGYAGMFGSNTESPKDDAYRMSPKIISSALNKYRKFKEGLK